MKKKINGVQKTKPEYGQKWFPESIQTHNEGEWGEKGKRMAGLFALPAFPILYSNPFYFDDHYFSGVYPLNVLDIRSTSRNIFLGNPFLVLKDDDEGQR